MVGLGMLFILISAWGLWLWWRDSLEKAKGYLIFVSFALFLPYLANSTGWIVTEMGRQPWSVQGLMLTAKGVSSNVTGPMVLFTMLGYTLLYALLLVADLYLLRRFALEGLDGKDVEASSVSGVHVY